MARLSNWPRELHRYIEEHRAQPFSWQTHHCCQFVAGAVLALTGRELPAHVSAPYEGPLAARRMMPDGLQAALTQVLGSSIQPAKVQRGDVMLMANDLSRANLGAVAGICEGEWSWFTGDNGLIRAKTLDCICGWPVR